MGSVPGYDTAWDRWLSLAGKLSWDVTTTQVNSVLHPSGVPKYSTSFSWGKGGKVTAAGWQITWWHVISLSGVVIYITKLVCPIYFPYLSTGYSTSNPHLFFASGVLLNDLGGAVCGAHILVPVSSLFASTSWEIFVICALRWWVCGAYPMPCFTNNYTVAQKNQTPVIFSSNFNKYWSISTILVQIISSESPVFTWRLETSLTIL